MPADRPVRIPRLVAVLVGLAALVGCNGERASDAERPNIVLLLVDDLGWKDVGYNGSTFHRTPTIDGLASRGVVFRHAYSAAPVCSPTRYSILTGKNPARGITKPLMFADFAPDGAAPEDEKPRRGQEFLSADSATFIPLDAQTLGTRLQAAGYRTGMIGKWHLGHAPYSADRYGFDEFVGGGIEAGPASYFPPYGLSAFPDGDEGEYLTDRVTKEATAFIERSQDAPFFLFVSYFAVHNPYIAKPDVVEQYMRTMDLAAGQKNPKYAAMLQAVDESVATILAALDANGVADRTVILFTSDNGAIENKNVKVNREPTVYPVTSNAPLRDGKGSLYEGGVRVPFVAFWPGRDAAGRTVDEPIVSTDLYSTVLDLAGAPADTGSDGASIVPLLGGEQTLSRGPLFFHYPHGKLMSSVRAGRHKLIRFWNGATELYDLEADEGEAHDLAAEQPELTQRLDAELSAWLEDVGAELPRENPNWRGR